MPCCLKISCGSLHDSLQHFSANSFWYPKIYLPFSTIASSNFSNSQFPWYSLKVQAVGPDAVAHAYNPNTLGGGGGWITRSRDRDHPGQQGETPSLQKIQKLAGHGGAHL